MKYFLVLAACVFVAANGQSSNETAVEVAPPASHMASSNETMSAEVPSDPNTAESTNLDSKQTSSLQSAEKPALKVDDDNSGLATKPAAVNSGLSKDIAPSAEASGASAGSVEHPSSSNTGTSGIENSASTNFIGSTLFVIVALANSINFM